METQQPQSLVLLSVLDEATGLFEHFRFRDPRTIGIGRGCGVAKALESSPYDEIASLVQYRSLRGEIGPTSGAPSQFRVAPGGSLPRFGCKRWQPSNIAPRLQRILNGSLVQAVFGDVASASDHIAPGLLRIAARPNVP
jgi:hypothetical protein